MPTPVTLCSKAVAEDNVWHCSKVKDGISLGSAMDSVCQDIISAHLSLPFLVRKLCSLNRVLLFPNIKGRRALVSSTVRSCLAATVSAQVKHVTDNLLKEQLFRPLCSSSLLSLALDPRIELPIERAFAHLYCVPAPLLIEFITPSTSPGTYLCVQEHLGCLLQVRV